MNRLARTLGSNRCLGVYAGLHRVSWATVDRMGSRVHPDGTGVREIESPSMAAQVVGELVASHVARYGPASPIVIGLPAERAYVLGIPDAQPEDVTAAEVGAVRAGYFNPSAVDNMSFDVVGKSRSMLSIAASPVEHTKALVAACNAAGAFDVRIEPVAKSLAEQAQSVMKKGKLRVGAAEHAIHLLQSEGSCLALWSCGALPLGCRTLRDHDGGRPALEDLFTAVRGMEVYGTQRLKVTGNPQVILHGSLADPTIAQPLQAMLEMRVGTVLGLDASAEALAVALSRSARRRRAGECDLGKGNWAAGPLISFVPMREAAAVAAAGLLMTISLWWNVWSQQARASMVERANQLNSTLSSGTDAELRAERARLEEEVGAVRRFVMTRRTWTPALGEVADRVPPTARLDGFMGQDELTTGAGKAEKRVKRQLLIDYSCPFPVNSTVPHEAEEAVRKMRGAPTTASVFPVIELAMLSLDRNKASERDPDKAKFSVLCRPRGGAS